MNEVPVQNGWNEWSKYVLSELQRLNTSYEGLRSETEKIRVEIATLKVKSGVWGAAGAMVPIAIIVILWIMKGVVRVP